MTEHEPVQPVSRDAGCFYTSTSMIDPAGVIPA
jgi:hypothetical protein